MITPGYSPTATERVLPRLALDFTTASLDSRVTVTRSLDTATRINASGQFELVNANLPRFDYDPITLACKGLLIEETRVNSVINSGFQGAVAGTPGTAPTSWSAVASTGRISNVTSDGLGGNFIEVTSSTQRYILQQNITLNANTTYVASMYIAANTGVPYYNIFFASNTPAGATVTYYADSVLVVDTTTYVPTAGQRLSIVMAVGATAGSVNLRCGVGTAANATGTVSFSKTQLEAGSFPTSYIPTTSTSLTRNADAVSMTGTNFSDWFNATEGTFSIDCIINTKPAAQILMEMSDGTSANRIQYQRDSGSNGLSYVAIVSSSITVNLQKASTFVNDTASITAAYKLDNYGVAVNGGATTTDTSSGVPSVDRMRIGATVAGTAPSNGWYQKIFYYPQRLTNSEIQAFSK